MNIGTCFPSFTESSLLIDISDTSKRPIRHILQWIIIYLLVMDYLFVRVKINDKTKLDLVETLELSQKLSKEIRPHNILVNIRGIG